MNEDQIIESLRRVAAASELGEVDRDRLRTRFDCHVSDRAVRRAPARWRRPVAVAAAGALVLVVVVASLPAFDSSDGPEDARHTLAQAALLRAANAAGRAPWQPLASGEFFHVYTTSLPASESRIKSDPRAPKIVPSPGAKPVSIEHWDEGGGPSGVQSNESWYDASGTGLGIYVDGGDPSGKYKPSYYRDPKSGKVLGMGGHQVPPGTDVDASLAVARSVTVRAQPVRGRSWQRVWGLMGRRYELTYDQRDAPTPDEVPESFATPLFQAWFITPEQLRRLNDPSGDVDARVDAVITDALRSGAGLANFNVPIGTFGRTATSVDTEDGVQLAVGWLGRAPLAPTTRRALFEWIAARKGARLTRDVVDAVGRRGTRVTFETRFDQQVPAEFIDRERLVAMAREAGVKDADRISTKLTWNVPAHREYRRWVFSFIFDERSGELLESYGGSIEHATGLKTNLPDVYRYPDKFVVRTLQATSTRGSGSAGTLYRARERAREIEPRSTICVKVPKVCEPGVPIN